MKNNTVRIRMAHQLLKVSKTRKQNIWRVAGMKIEGPRRNRSLVNVGEISKNTDKGSTVLVAGKVLGAGDLTHAVNVGAYSFSEGARIKIKNSGGNCFGLEDFMNQNKSMKDVVILG